MCSHFTWSSRTLRLATLPGASPTRLDARTCLLVECGAGSHPWLGGGWADRLRHLLLSGMVVLKQQTQAIEWFEPLLVPWVHYIPVSSTLHNLSEAVHWVRAHPSMALQIAEAGAELMEDVASSPALTAYTARLFHGFATMFSQEEATAAAALAAGRSGQHRGVGRESQGLPWSATPAVTTGAQSPYPNPNPNPHLIQQGGGWGD